MVAEFFLSDDHYVESIDYAKGDNIEKLLGVNVKFDWKIVDGFFHQSGKFPDGFYIHEKMGANRVIAVKIYFSDVRSNR